MLMDKPVLWSLLCIQNCMHAGPLQGPKAFTAGLSSCASFGRRKLHSDHHVQTSFSKYCAERTSAFAAAGCLGQQHAKRMNCSCMYATSCGMQARTLPERVSMALTKRYVCHLHIHSRLLVCSHKADTSWQAAILVLCVCTTCLPLCACTSQVA